MAVDGESHRVELGAPGLHLGQERRVLGRQAVADRVRQVDRGRPGLDRRPADLCQELRIRPGRVLGRELDLVHAPVRIRHRGPRLLQDFRRLEAELSLHVDRAGRDEGVQPRAVRVGDRFDRGVDVIAARPRERGDRRVAGDPRNGPDPLEVTG